MHAGLLEGEAAELLLHELGFPATGGLIMAPTERPVGLPRPNFGHNGFNDKPAVWAEVIEEDLRPIQFGDCTVLAEITRFERLYYRRKFTVDRLRLHAPDEIEFASIDEALGRLPSVLNLATPVAAYRRPSRHVVARFIPHGLELISAEPPVI
jgi:hypothetical protein